MLLMISETDSLAILDFQLAHSAGNQPKKIYFRQYNKAVSTSKTITFMVWKRSFQTTVMSN